MSVSMGQGSRTEAARPGSEMTVETIRRRAAGGTVSLTVRLLAHKVISFSGGIALSRLLSPGVFGVFGAVTYVVNFFGFFGDIGFAAALIQRKEHPSERVLRTTFALQQGLVAILVLMLFGLSPILAQKYHLPASSAWLFRGFSLSLFLTAMKVIPSTHLQRRLDFKRIVIPEIAEVAVYQCVAVTMALLGYGVWSLVCATLARGAVGFAILFIFAPWRMGFAFDKKVAREIVTFGAPFQLGQFFWLIRDGATPVFVGALCGMSAVGYVNWAWGLALLPYTVVEIVNRVVFPVCSRLQNDRETLGRSLQKFVRMSALGVFPIAAVMIAVAPYAIRYVYTPKWTPSLPSLYLFLLSTMASPIMNVYSRTFYALGMAKTAVKLTAICVLLGWALNVPLVLAYGYVGIAWSSLLAAPLSIWLPIREMRKIVSVRVGRAVWAPLVSSLVSLALTRWVATAVISGVVTLVAVTLLGLVIYAAAMLALQGRLLLSEANIFRDMLKGACKSEENRAEPPE